MWFYVYRLSDGVYVACSLEAQLAQFDASLYAWNNVMPPPYDWSSQKTVWNGNEWSIQTI